MFPRLLLLSMFVATALGAETVTHGDHEIHYSIFNTGFLEPAIAESYDIVRGYDRALLNIAVRKQTGGTDQATAAILNGRVNDLVHKRDLSFREIREQGAIYYLAPVQFRDRETLYFEIEVRTSSDAVPYKLVFRHTFYRDEAANK